MSLPALYEIAAEYRQAVAQLADLDLPPEVVTDTLESLTGDLQAKSQNVAMFVLSLESTAAAIKKAEADMAARRKAIENRAERVREYLKTHMEACGISKIECPWFKLAIRQNLASVVIDDAGLIPSNLYVYPDPPTPYPDKKAIKDEIEANGPISGAHLERKTRLEIKP